LEEANQGPEGQTQQPDIMKLLQVTLILLKLQPLMMASWDRGTTRIVQLSVADPAFSHLITQCKEANIAGTLEDFIHHYCVFVFLCF
jgi:hypothetical protein